MSKLGWEIIYSKYAIDDLEKFDRSTRIKVSNKINQVAINPLPESEGGYGKSLRNSSRYNLANCCKIRIGKIKAVYQLIRIDNKMMIIVVQVRSEEAVYKSAFERLSK